MKLGCGLASEWGLEWESEREILMESWLDVLWVLLKDMKLEFALELQWENERVILME